MMAQSAAGLFAATGKRSKAAPEREKDDFYPTPPEATEALLRAEARRLEGVSDIWEPAAGDGAMAAVMASYGFLVVVSDLIDRGCDADLQSFYAFRKAPAGAIVTNPPFQECNWRDGRGRWILHAIDVLGVEYMALLLPWTWPGAGGLASLWARIPPQRVYMCRWKIDFTGEGNQPANHGWFVWDRSALNIETQLLMLDKPRASIGQATMDLGGSNG